MLDVAAWAGSPDCVLCQLDETTSLDEGEIVGNNSQYPYFCQTWKHGFHIDVLCWYDLKG